VLAAPMAQATTSELRSPLSILRGPYHYPFGAVDKDIWSLKIDKIEDDESLWLVDWWTTGYGRKADKAYIDCCNTCCGWNECCQNQCCCNQNCTTSSCCTNTCNIYCCWDNVKNTTNTVPLSMLFFGKASFKGEEAFANGMLVNPGGSIGLRYAKLSPRFDYNEAGAVIGLHLQRRFNQESKWHFGARASVPIKVIEMEQRRSCGSERFEETLADMIVEYQQQFTDEKPNAHLVAAYRLDFLSALMWTSTKPLVYYGNGSDNSMIAEVEITPVSQAGFSGSIAPVSALRQNDGRLPAPTPDTPPVATPSYYPLAQDVDVGVSPPVPTNPLAADGSGGSNQTRLTFVKAQNYAAGLALNRDAQSKLFIVPNTQGAGNGVLETNGLLIQNKIQYLLNQLNLTERDSAEQFFKDHCVSFCLSDYVAGFGDLDTEFYIGREFKHGFVDGILGVRFPTGKKPDDARRIFYQALGNKGHFEFKGALEGGWHPCDWFALRSYLSYSYVFSAKECRAPAFCGATIKNIPAGCAVEADVKWDYFLGNIDFNWFHPDNPNLGCTLGYELYAKRNDRVCFCCTKALDFFSNEETLSNYILECGTNTMTHKIRGEIFDRIGFCEFFGGGSWIFAGRNAMKETELHIGVAIYF